MLVIYQLEVGRVGNFAGYRPVPGSRWVPIPLLSTDAFYSLSFRYTQPLFSSHWSL